MSPSERRKPAKKPVFAFQVRDFELFAFAWKQPDGNYLLRSRYHGA